MPETKLRRLERNQIYTEHVILNSHNRGAQGLLFNIPLYHMLYEAENWYHIEKNNPL